MAFNNIDVINSTFQKVVRSGKFIDNVGKRTPFLNWLRTSGCFAFWGGEGKYIHEPVLKTLRTGKSQSMDPYDVLNIVPDENTENVPFNRKTVRHPIVLAHEQVEQNMGEEKIIDLVEQKMTEATIYFANDLDVMFFGDGTGSSGKDFLGLGALIPDTQTSGTLGGFARSTNSWLQSPSISGAKTAQAFDNLRKKMSNLKNTLSRGTMVPSIYITDQATYEGYEDLSYGKWMPTSKEAYDLGFSGGLTFAGKPVVFGDNVTAGNMFALNPDSLKLRVKGLKSGEKNPFQVSQKFDMAPKQFVYVWVLHISGALTCNYFRQMGKLYGCS